MAGTDPFAAVAKPAPAAQANDPFAAVAKPVRADPGPASPNVQPTAYGQVIQRAASAAGLSPLDVRAVHEIEDPSESPNITSSAGAVGEMQIKPSTFADYARPGESIDNPVDNFNVGARYLAALKKQFHGDMHQVFRAYNAGPGAATEDKDISESYARQAEANVLFLERSMPPALPTKKLSKGSVKPTSSDPFSKAAKGQKPPALPPGTTQGPNDIAPQPDDWVNQALGPKGQAVTSEALGINDIKRGWDNMDPKTKARILELHNWGPVKTATHAAGFLGSVVSLAPEAFNAIMRDVADGKTNNVGLVGQNLWHAMQHPMQAGDFLNQIADKYGVNSREEILYWASKPGWRDRVAAAQGLSAPGQQLQIALGLHADLARFLATHTGAADLMSGLIAWYNPANKIPGAILTRASKPVAGLSGVAARTSYDMLKKASPRAAAHAADIGHWVASNAPLIGDRFHSTQVEAGEKAMDEHRFLAEEQARAPRRVQAIFKQEHMYGGTSIPEQQRILREHDRFFNQHETSHVKQQGGAPAFDPLTQTTIAGKGGKSGAEHRQHVYIAHTDPLILQVPRTTRAGLLKMFDQGTADQLSNAIHKGDYKVALSVGLPHLDPAQIQHFEQQVAARTAGMRKADALALGENLVMRRIIGEYGRKNGYRMVEWGDDDRLYTQPMPAIPHDTEMIGPVSAHDRAVNIASAQETLFDDPIRTMAPGVAAHFLEGYHPRSGAFKKDMTLNQEIQQQDMSAQSMPRTGGTGVNPGTPRRRYKSIREAELDPALGGGGEQMDPNFSPAAAMQKAATRSMRFQNYVQFLKNYAKPINFEKAVADAAREGLQVHSAFVPMVPTGAAGAKEFYMYIEQQAKLEADRLLGPRHGPVNPNQGGGNFAPVVDTQSDKQIKDLIDVLKKRMFKQVEANWERNHPRMVWDVPKHSGVDDMEGMTVPKWVNNANIDSHPAFDASGKPSDRKWLDVDPPESVFENIVDSSSHVLRSLFLIDPTFHQRENLSYILFSVGELNPIEVAHILYNPEGAVSPALLQEAEQMNATSGHGNTSLGGSRVQGRYAYAAPEQTLHRNYIKGIMNTRDRIRTFKQGMSKAVDGQHGFGVPMHALGYAVNSFDKWNADFTFGVYEDVSSAMLYGKLKAKFLGQGKPLREAQLAAARETREALGDSRNMTQFERKLGLQRLTWFYSWFKGQMKLWARKYANPRVVGSQAVIQQVNNTQNQLTAPDGQKKADDGKVVMWMGDQRVVFKDTPGPESKIRAIGSLVGAIPTDLEGISDFARFAANSAAYQLSPQVKVLMQIMDPTFAGGSGIDQSIPGQDAAAKSVEGTIGGIVPQQVRAAFKPSVQEKLGVLGVPVVPYDAQFKARHDALVKAKLDKIEKQKLYRAAGSQQRADIKSEMAPRREQLMQQLLRDKGQ